MLEFVDVPKSGRETAYLDGDAQYSATFKKGTMVLLSGTHNAAAITALPAGQKNTPGFAVANDPRVTRGFAGSGGRAFPMDVFIFQPENDDDSLDTIKKGQQVTYYTAGTFRTTEFTDVGAAVFGDFLKVTASGTLTIEATATTETSDSVARVIELQNSATAANEHRLMFKLISGDG